MQPKVFHSKLANIYHNYNETIKPLIADIEARYQEFPDSLFNEIRALNDHVARCYRENISDEEIDSEIKKTEGHILRITFDCYKYLDVWFHDYVKKFDKEYTSKIDITLVSDGEFAIEYRSFQSKAIKAIKEAKKNEGIDKQKSFDLYQEAYGIYSDLEMLIDEHLPKLNHAKCRKKVKLTTTGILWVFSILLSSIITIILTDRITSLLKNIF